MAWVDVDDDFDYVRERETRHLRRPSPRRFRSDSRRSQHLLDPNVLLGDGGGLARTRSQGARPNPIIINNEFIHENNGSSAYLPYPPSPDTRPRGRLSGDLVDDFVDLALENQRLRSRSRGWSDATRADRRDEYYEELRRKEKQLAELERKASLEDERERIKHELELQRLKDEAKRKADEAAAKEERKRILDEYEWDQRGKEDKRKEERKRILDEYELDQREKEDKRKEEERLLREKIKREEREKKEKEEREWDEFMLRLKAKEDKEKAEKKKKEEEIDNALRDRLLNAGYSKAYADRIVEEDKQKTTTTTTTLITTGGNIGRPTYVKVHKDYLSIETLRYHNLPWEYDKKDKDYIVILREISQGETDILFEHTKSLRQGRLLLEPPKKEAQYAWVRKRDRSSSRVKKLAIVKSYD